MLRRGNSLKEILCQVRELHKLLRSMYFLIWSNIRIDVLTVRTVRTIHHIYQHILYWCILIYITILHSRCFPNCLRAFRVYQYIYMYTEMTYVYWHVIILWIFTSNIMWYLNSNKGVHKMKHLRLAVPWCVFWPMPKDRRASSYLQQMQDLRWCWVHQNDVGNGTANGSTQLLFRPVTEVYKLCMFSNWYSNCFRKMSMQRAFHNDSIPISSSQIIFHW